MPMTVIDRARMLCELERKQTEVTEAAAKNDITQYSNRRIEAIDLEMALEQDGLELGEEKIVRLAQEKKSLMDGAKNRKQATGTLPTAKARNYHHGQRRSA